MNHYIFIDKKTANGKFKKIEIYGSITALCKENDIYLYDNKKPSSHWTVRQKVIDAKNHYDDENICIKKCRLVRSKVEEKQK